MADFPIPAPAFTGDCRVVPSARAFDWLRYGWALFAAEPGQWVGIAVLFLVITIATSVVPLIGTLAAHLLLPVMLGGIMLGCQRFDEGGIIAVPDLFAGFTLRSRELVTVGVIYMVAWLAIFLVGGVVGGSALAGGMLMKSPAGFGIALGGFLVALLLVVALSLPLLMALWFAPALVILQDMKAVPALQASFMACARNWLVFSVFGIIATLLFFFAVLPVFLGLLVFFPVMFGALYASYRDIFVGA